jgi:hypothetical protein
LFVVGDDLVVGVDGLVELTLQNFNFSLLAQGLGFVLFALESVQFLLFSRVVLHKIIPVFLGAKKLAFILFEDARVIINFFLKDLIGGFCEYGAAVGRLVEVGFFQFLVAASEHSSITNTDSVIEDIVIENNRKIMIKGHKMPIIIRCFPRFIRPLRF